MLKKNIPNEFDLSKLSKFRTEKSYTNNSIRVYYFELIILLCSQNVMILNTNLPLV